MPCPPEAMGAHGDEGYPEAGKGERGSGAGALVWLPGEPGKDVREWPGKMVFASPGMEPSVGCSGMTVLWAGAEGQCPYCKGR